MPAVGFLCRKRFGSRIGLSLAYSVYDWGPIDTESNQRLILLAKSFLPFGLLASILLRAADYLLEGSSLRSVHHPCRMWADLGMLPWAQALREVVVAILGKPCSVDACPAEKV